MSIEIRKKSAYNVNECQPRCICMSSVPDIDFPRMDVLGSDGKRLTCNIVKESVIYDGKKSKNPVPLSPRGVLKLQHHWMKIGAKQGHCSIEEDPIEDEMDGRESNSSSSSSPSSSSSSSSEGSTSSPQQQTKIKIKASKMVISGQKICRVKSSENPSKTGEYHHYIENVGPDSVKDSLKRYDRIVQINDENIKDYSCSHVRQLLKNLRTEVGVSVVLWRWLNKGNRTDVLEIKLVIGETSRCHCTKDLSNIDLTPRKFKDMTWTTYEPRNFHIRVACETGVYLCVDRNITCVYGYPIRERREMSLFKFGVRFFKCKAMDSKRRYQAYFGCVFIFEDEGQLFDISSTLGEESAAVILKPHTAFSLDSPDERFFLMHGIEDGDDVFESLNYENMCMKIEISSQKIVMQYLGISNPVTKKSFKITKPSFKFQTFSIKAAKELMESYPGHQKKSKGRGLLFLCFGIGASFDISNVPCLEWSSFALEAINSSVRKSIYLK